MRRGGRNESRGAGLMAQDRADAVLGAIVLAAAIAFLLYIGQATGLSTQRGGYDLHASFRSAEGVTVGTDVRLGGVKVGTVTAMDLNPQTFRADLRFTMRDSLLIPQDSAVSVASEGLLGGTYVEIIPGGSPLDLAPGDIILDTQSAVSLVTLLLRFVTGGTEAAPAPTPQEGDGL
jgi:phospholipid/cholesterol/gamma-HCH transport system substrate-binding protein